MERPSLNDLPAFGGEKVSPLRAFSAPVETTGLFDALIRSLTCLMLLLAAVPAAAQSPQRVVTLNLCLDQIALRLAAPGQLVGVSYLSHDPRLSVLADRAAAHPTGARLRRIDPRPCGPIS